MADQSDRTQSGTERSKDENGDLGESFKSAPQQVRQMFNAGISSASILVWLTEKAEQLAGDDAVCSILVLDSEGLLRNGASPKLPQDYLSEIDGLKPNPNVGTCAAAAATGSMVITSDFRADDKWGELRHLPLAIGFVGAWSLPIKSIDGRILGTFGTYFRRPRVPTPFEQKCMHYLAEAAALILLSSV